MPYRDAKLALRDLIAVASGQGGYFTARQAQQHGYASPHLRYHLSVKNFEKAGHGIYRLPIIPTSEHDDLIRLSLWSRNDRDEPQAVVSHDSAIALHDLGEIIPSKTHLTVPATFRKLAPPGCMLHKAMLEEQEIEERTGFKVTTPLRSILDVVDSTVSQEQLDKIVQDAIRRGMVSRKALIERAKELEPNNRLLRVRELNRKPGR